jgi:hypothetical protein
MCVHWDTFKLTQESFDQPPRDLSAALKAHGLANDSVWQMRHGETRAILKGLTQRKELLGEVEIT